MYNEIRRSPLAEEIKQEYEDVIAEWSEKFNDLQNLYESALQQNQQLQSDLDLERREYLSDMSLTIGMRIYASNSVVFALQNILTCRYPN